MIVVASIGPGFTTPFGATFRGLLGLAVAVQEEGVNGIQSRFLRGTSGNAAGPHGILP